MGVWCGFAFFEVLGKAVWILGCWGRRYGYWGFMGFGKRQCGDVVWCFHCRIRFFLSTHFWSDDVLNEITGF
ncbi:hypothetical protein BC829DRAFT_405555 [Chytridium lagenaria]|nr:hypothetical protein BC829DRAFT_405555 [Chytridium lagenaria]